MGRWIEGAQKINAQRIDRRYSEKMKTQGARGITDGKNRGELEEMECL